MGAVAEWKRRVRVSQTDKGRGSLFHFLENRLRTAVVELKAEISRRRRRETRAQCMDQWMLAAAQVRTLPDYCSRTLPLPFFGSRLTFARGKQPFIFV